MRRGANFTQVNPTYSNRMACAQFIAVIGDPLKQNNSPLKNSGAPQGGRSLKTTGLGSCGSGGGYISNAFANVGVLLTVRPHQKRIERPNRRKSFTFYGQERPKRPTLPAAKV